MKKGRLETLAKLAAWIREQGEALDAAIDLAGQTNPWFIRRFCELSLQNLSSAIGDTEQISTDCGLYCHANDRTEARKVGVVLPGKAPLAGIRDVISVSLLGHNALIKCANDDDILWQPIIRKWQELDAVSAPQIVSKLKQIDAILFSQPTSSRDLLIKYFQHIPHLVGRDCTSIALLTGKETRTELRVLLGDVLNYFGLGARSVSHLLVPKDFDLSMLLDTAEEFRFILKNNRYRSNLDFHLAKAMLNRTEHLHSDVLALVQSEDPHSPTGILHYKRYVEMSEVSSYLRRQVGEYDVLFTNDRGNWGVPSLSLGCSDDLAISDTGGGKRTFEFLANL